MAVLAQADLDCIGPLQETPVTCTFQQNVQTITRNLSLLYPQPQHSTKQCRHYVQRAFKILLLIAICCCKVLRSKSFCNRSKTPTLLPERYLMLHSQRVSKKILIQSPITSTLGPSFVLQQLPVRNVDRSVMPSTQAETLLGTPKQSEIERNV